MAAPHPEPRIFPMGDRALVVEFGSGIDLVVNARARAFAEQLLARPLPCVTDVVPGYACVTVHFDPIRARGGQQSAQPMEAMREVLVQALGRVRETSRRKPRTIEIPVCYGGEHGPDFGDLCQRSGLTADEVVRLHSEKVYMVYLLGFVPGFGYLGGLDRRLHMPRRPVPRKRIPAGSVAIGGEQTGVYPLETPGGWNLIGRTPHRMFRVEQEAPTVMEAGDQVRFVPISGTEFDRIKAAQR